MDSSVIVQLFRCYIKEAKVLPEPYLRKFYILRARDRVRSVAATKDHELFWRKVKYIRRDIARLRTANTGDKSAFERILAKAYGRSGKLKWELLEPILMDPSQPLPKKVIPAVPSSRPPVYHPALRALLKYPLARTSKNAVANEHLNNPPNLPERAINRTSDEARLLGPFSKRREVNIRRRFFGEVTRRLFPPLGIEGGENMDARASSLGFGGNCMVKRIEALSGVATSRPSIPRREMKEMRAKGSSVTESTRPNQTPLPLPSVIPVLSTPWLRRRYRALLASVPIVVEKHHPLSSANPTFEVSLSPYAIREETKSSMGRLGVARPSDEEWIERATLLSKAPSMPASSKFL